MEKENYVTTVESKDSPSTTPASAVASKKELETYLSNADVALQVIMEDADEEPISPEEEKKLLHKIDRHLIPIMFISYFLQFLDKNALSNSSVFGLSDDLHLASGQYSWCGSLFYFGYLVAQPLASRMLQHFSIAHYVGVCLILWSVILICTAATKNFAGLATIRVLLGVFEATVSPAWVLVTGMWYKNEEMPLRTSWWYCGNALGVIFGGLISYGLGHISSAIASWKWFYIIYGIVTFLWGFVVFFCMTDSIATANWLNKREKYVAIERIRHNRTGVKNKVFKKEQAIEALTDPQVIMLALLEFVANLPAGGIQNFGNLIIKSFGFTSFQTVLINMPSGLIQGITLLLAGLINSRYPNSATIVLSLCNIPCLIGTCLVKYLHNTPSSQRAGRMVAFWIQYCNTMSSVSMFALMQRNVSGFTKKTVAGALFFICYCAAQISAPQLFKSKEAPSYTEGFKMMIVAWVIMIILPIVLYLYLRRQNKLRDERDAADTSTEKEPVENEEFLDLTDKQQKYFRYTL